MNLKNFRRELKFVSKNIESILEGKETSNIVEKVILGKVAYLGAESLSNIDLSNSYSSLSGSYLHTFYNAFVDQLATKMPSVRIKRAMYSRILGKIGSNVNIAPDSRFDFLMPNLISLGDDVVVGMGAKLYTHAITKNKIKVGRVNLGNESLLGGYSVILPGSSIGEGTEVGFRNFINRDVGNNSFLGPNVQVYAEIGDDCRIGAGTSIYKTVEDGSIVDAGSVYR